MCKKENCGCGDCSNSNSSTQNNSSTENKVENVYSTLPGHPIIMIDELSDTELFNIATGEGSGIWEGWALMDGKTHYDINNGKAAIICTDMMDRCPVMAGNTYNIGDTFGTATHALTSAENGAHNHTITDAGHTHTLTDAGHTHTLTDAGHNHTLTDPGHIHTLTNTLSVNSNIAAASHIDSSVQVKSGSDSDVPDTWTDYTAGLGGSLSVNTHATGITLASSATGATVASAATGATVAPAATGISLASSGSGTAHENRQPSYALLFIKRIYVPA